MQPVHPAPSSPRASQEGDGSVAPSTAPAQPRLSQRHAEADVRRFFASGQLQARASSDLSQSRAALPPPSTTQD